jgi:hypothetical protein
MNAGFRPMEVQSKSLRDELTQHAIPAPAPARVRLSVTSRLILSSKSKQIVVERLRTRSKPAASGKAQKLVDA